MAVSAICLLLPNRYTQPVRGAVQFLVPFQDAAYRFTRMLAEHVDDLASPEPTRRQHNELLKQAHAMQNRLVAIETECRQLRRENEFLVGFRREAALSGAKLVPARVFARSAAGFTEVLAIGRGRQTGVTDHDYVASLLIAHGRDTPLRTAMAVVGSEYLIGLVARADSFTARVILFDDPNCPPQQICIGRLSDEGLTVFSRTDPATGQQREQRFLLTGKGGGRMLVEQVPVEYLENERSDAGAEAASTIRVGDLAVTVATDPSLPTRMVIGQIVQSTRDPTNPLICDLEVRCPIDPTRLQWVYVVDMSPPAR
jgi:cell shape-determining protein MreC